MLPQRFCLVIEAAGGVGSVLGEDVVSLGGRVAESATIKCPEKYFLYDRGKH
jgi:hypothetical protein